MASQPTISFVLRGKPDRWGLKALALSYAYKYKTNYIWTGHKLKPEEWDKRRQMAKSKKTQLDNGTLPIRINQILLDLRVKAMNIVSELNDANISPIFDDFKKKMGREDGSKTIIKFLSAVIRGN